MAVIEYVSVVLGLGGVVLGLMFVLTGSSTGRRAVESRTWR